MEATLETIQATVDWIQAIQVVMVIGIGALVGAMLYDTFH